MKDPIAERRLEFRETRDAPVVPVFVRIGRPYLHDAEGKLWAIDYEIDGPNDHYHAARVYGSDAMQTLGLVFPVLNALIDAVHRDGLLSYDGSPAAARLP